MLSMLIIPVLRKLLAMLRICKELQSSKRLTKELLLLQKLFRPL
jgi:hypothetical protein